MKTPEEIEKGLACHAERAYPCSADQCPYFNSPGVCTRRVTADAIVCIRWLKEERDALLAALKKCDLDCTYCKYNTDNDGRCTDPNVDCEACEIACPCRSCVDMDKWEWRKPKEAE